MTMKRRSFPRARILLWLLALLGLSVSCVPPKDEGNGGDASLIDSGPGEDSGNSNDADAGTPDAGDASDSGSADDGGQGNSDSGACTPDIPYDSPELALSFFGPPQMQPGTSRDFDVLQIECCYIPNPVAMCESWSVSPEGQGATIDENGVFTLESTVENGATFLVQATLGDGSTISTTVYVYTPEGNPLVGTYSEAAQISCTDGMEVPPDEPIGEVRFLADGTFNVTWTPFEVYVDYWGPYTYDLGTGAITLTATGGNYIPDDLDGEGFFEVNSEGDLILTDMWLGSPQFATVTTQCGHRFQ
jgi:hypothetical protein